MAVIYPKCHRFAVISFIYLIGLIVCLRRYERAEPGSELREKMELSVRLVTTTLALLSLFVVTLIFLYMYLLEFLRSQ